MALFLHRFVAATGLLMLLSATPIPARAEVHLAWMKGAVTVQHAGDGAWSAAILDAPLADGDRIATGPKAQADIQLDEANVVHAGANAEVRLDQLEPGRYRMTVVKGAIACHVAGTSTADVEVGTPSVSVRPSHPGVYLINVNRAAESEILVRAGDVEVVAPRGSEWVNAGQKMVARGPASDPQYKIGHAVPLWRRVAVVMANCIEIANSISASMPTGGGPAQTSSTTAKPTTPSPAPAPSRPTAPSPPPHTATGGKG